MQIRVMGTTTLLLGALAWGCADSGSTDAAMMSPAIGSGGMSGSSPSAAGNNAMGGGGSGGSTAPATNNGGSSGRMMGGGDAGRSGMPPGGMGGAGSGSGGMSAAGAGAGAGGDTAGAGGSMGTAGSTGGGDCGPMAFACRGDDPTEMSANGRQKGPYTVESYTSGYMRGDFSDATMWYPTNATPPFGCVAVVPGFVSPQSSIRNWGPFLASHGIVAITIGVPGTDQPAQRANSLMSALETCKGENTRSGSPLVGKISENHLGVSGWSMGGGGTLIAASRTPTLKGAVSFAAWGPTGGANNKVPALMFQATADALAAGMSNGFYRATPETTPKMLFEVSGSSHNVANDPANHSGIIGLYGLSWWKVFLEGDERYRKFLTAPFPSIVTSASQHNLK